MKKLASLYVQDMKIMLRNSFVWLMMGTIVIFMVLYHLVLPDTVEQHRVVYFLDRSENQVIAGMLPEEETGEVVWLNSMAELEKMIAEGETPLGIVFEGTLLEPRFTIVHGELMKEENINIVAASLRSMLAGMAGITPQAQYATVFLGERTEPIPQNKMAVPLVLLYEVAIFSFFLSAVFIFQEKAEGTIKAYRITTAGAGFYIASKTLAFVTKGVIYASLFVLLTLGWAVNWLALLPVLIAGTMLFGFLGMSLATFFNNLSEWFFVGMVGLIINMLPIFTMLSPTFSPFYIEFIPTYSILVLFNEILFPTGRQLTPQIIMLAIFTVLAYIACHLLVSNKLMKEGAR